MRYGEFLAAVAANGGPTDRDYADQATKTVLDDLGKRLAGNEARDLASQLPQELQEPLVRHNGEQETADDLDEFLRRVADHEGRGCDADQARVHARSVLATVASFVSQGEIDDLRAQLPAGYAPLFD